MKKSTNELLELIELEQLEVDLFRGIGTGGETSTRIFGGHVIAQALAAAYKTVNERMCHSLHAYFIRPGDPSIPVLYEVDRARDGGSFTTRRVIAIQNGKQILNMSASFHIDEKGWDYDPLNGLTVLKGDMGYYYDSDPVIQEAQAKIEYLKEVVDTVKEILDNVKWRHQNIKNMIEWRKFTSGI